MYKLINCSIILCKFNTLLTVCYREDSEIVYDSQNAFAPVAYLKLRKLLLREKEAAQSSRVSVGHHLSEFECFGKQQSFYDGFCHVHARTVGDIRWAGAAFGGSPL